MFFMGIFRRNNSGSVCHRFISNFEQQISQVKQKKRHMNTEISTQLSQNGAYNIHDAILLAKQLSWSKMDETVEVVVNTGLDPRKPNQNVKGIVRLPHGTGKKVRICVIASAAEAEQAKLAGADVVGGEEAIAIIQGGDINFNTVIATPEMMSMVGKIGKVILKMPYILFLEFETL
jgi:large subunit ribosomal protein L1